MPKANHAQPLPLSRKESARALDAHIDIVCKVAPVILHGAVSSERPTETGETTPSQPRTKPDERRLVESTLPEAGEAVFYERGTPVALSLVVGAEHEEGGGQKVVGGGGRTRGVVAGGKGGRGGVSYARGTPVGGQGGAGKGRGGVRGQRGLKK
jgi:hypothetical protein